MGGAEPQVSVRFATASDAESVAAIMKGAAEHQRQVGAPAWDEAATGSAIVEGLIGRQECVVASARGQIVGAMALQWRDELFWPDRNDDAAGYLHRIAVRRAFAGGRATTPLVAYAEQEAARRRKRFLRLDCAPLPKLMAVYERLGFEQVDVIRLPSNAVMLGHVLGPDFRSARFERRLG